MLLHNIKICIIIITIKGFIIFNIRKLKLIPIAKNHTSQKTLNNKQTVLYIIINTDEHLK